jgi:hypothetical protein
MVLHNKSIYDPISDNDHWGEEWEEGGEVYSALEELPSAPHKLYGHYPNKILIDDNEEAEPIQGDECQNKFCWKRNKQ